MTLNISEFQGTTLGNVQVTNGQPTEDYALAAAGVYTCAENLAILYLYADAAHTLTWGNGKTMVLPSGFTAFMGVVKGNTFTVS